MLPSGESTFGKPLNRQWLRLVLFLADGHLRLDNSPAENANRPFVVGRKNWLFSQTPRGALFGTAMYSLIETAKINGLSPYDYRQFVFATLPTLDREKYIEMLLP